MNRLAQTLGLLLTFSICLYALAEEPPKQPDLKKHKAFALRVQKMVRENKLKEFARCFNEDALIDRAMRNLRLSEDMRSGVEKGLREKSVAGELAGQISKAVKQDGSYTLLRVRMVEGKPRALFRMLSHNALNYHDMVLAAEASGEIRIVDLYAAMSGELLSESMGRMMRLMMSGDPKQAERLDPNNDFMKNRVRILRFINNAQAGRCREALNDWAELPPSVKKEKLIALMRVIGTQGLLDEDEKGYQQAMDEFRKAFPDDPACDLVSLDNLFLKKKFRAFQRSVDRVESIFGRDPYLDVMRAAGFMEAENTDEAKKMARRAIKDEPDLVPAYWTLLTVCLRSRDHKESLRMLGEIEKRFKIKFGDLTEHEEYKEFVKSPEYKEWMKQRKKY